MSNTEEIGYNQWSRVQGVGVVQDTMGITMSKCRDLSDELRKGRFWDCLRCEFIARFCAPGSPMFIEVVDTDELREDDLCDSCELKVKQQMEY